MSNTSNSNPFEEAKKLYIELEIENFVELLKELKYSDELTEKNNRTSANDKRHSSLDIRKLAKIIASKYVNKLISDHNISSEEKLYSKIENMDTSEINKRKIEANKQVLGV
ncbi:hypothetical protein KJ671_01015 [Patescibacteria group bacterium]|nr:hypothetical protein [Patescibacteria group bacterium]